MTSKNRAQPVKTRTDPRIVTRATARARIIGLADATALKLAGGDAAGWSPWTTGR